MSSFSIPVLWLLSPALALDGSNKFTVTLLITVGNWGVDGAEISYAKAHRTVTACINLMPYVSFTLYAVHN